MSEISTHALPFGPEDITMVESSNIYGYCHEGIMDVDQEEDTLWVIFRSGDVWEYQVPTAVIVEFVEAESKGSAFYRLIRPVSGVKVGNIFEGGAE